MNQNLNKVKLKDSSNSYWRQVPIGEFVDFNPSESIQGGVEAKKIPMAMVKEFQRKIVGFEISNFNSGPKFRNGDTLVAKITPCLENGKTAFVDILEEGEVAFGSTEFIVLRENPNSNREFIYYLARSPLFREKAIKCMEGTSGRKRVNERALKRQEILIPDLPTQQKIAKVLSDLDAKIELNYRINTELEAMAKLVYEYWFVQFDFPVGFDSAQPPGSAQASGMPYKSSGGKMVWNEELKREIPEGWRSGNIMEIADFFGGGTPKTNVPEYWNGEYNFYTPADYEESIFSISTKEKITEKGVENCSSKLFKKGTIFITARGSVGKINVASEPMAMNQSCYALFGKRDLGYPFVFQHVKELVNYIKAKASGSIFNALVTNDFKFTKLPIPPENLIEAYNKQALSLFEKILANKKQNQELSTLRDWLLPMLMNGQVSVAEAEERVEEELGMVAEGEREQYGNNEK